MHFLVLLTDAAGAGHLRQLHMPEHLSFLAANACAIKVAGPTLNAVTQSSCGGAWYVTADSYDEVICLIKSDPFWPIGLREDVTVLQWNAVFSNGQRLI
jgi:uncharacterized protein